MISSSLTVLASANKDRDSAKGDLTPCLLFDISKNMKMMEAVQALTSLAHPSRLEVFRLLVSRGRLCAGELAERLELPKPTLSFHLKELTRSGLIEAEREGRVIYYGVRVTGFRELMDFLAEDCCQGRPELCLPNSGSPAKAASCC